MGHFCPAAGHFCPLMGNKNFVWTYIGIIGTHWKIPIFFLVRLKINYIFTTNCSLHNNYLNTVIIHY